MSAYQIYNIFSGICIGALIANWVHSWLMQKQERRHRAELNRMQQQIISEVKNSLSK